MDRVFEHGVFTQKPYVEPTASLTEPAPKPIAAPKAPAGERTIGTPDELGAFDLYLLLASRHRRERCAGRRVRMVGRTHAHRARRRTNLRPCRGHRVDDTGRVGPATRAFEAWAGDLPRGMATVRADGRTFRVRSCDPGPGTALPSPDPAILRAQNLLVFHNQLEVMLVGRTDALGIPLRDAKCAALEFVRSPQVSRLLSLPESQITADAVRDAISAEAPATRAACGL